jgi:hypothetical protein
MGLVSKFTDHADENGLFVANISMRDSIGFRDRYLGMLSDAAFDLGIQIGVNETEKGLELGFEDPAHYKQTMDVVEPQFDELLKAYSGSMARIMGIKSNSGGSGPSSDQERGDEFGDLSR